MVDLTAREMEDALRGKKKLTEADSNRLAKFIAQVERYVSGVLQKEPEQIKTDYLEPGSTLIAGSLGSSCDIRAKQSLSSSMKPWDFPMERKEISQYLRCCATIPV